MTFVGRTYLQTREPHPEDVAAVGLIHGRQVQLDPPREVVAVGGKWGRNILVRWPCGRLVVRPSRGLKKKTDTTEATAS